MNDILCSTGSLIGRPNGRDITLLQKYYREIGCDGFEFMMYDTWYDSLAHIRRVIETIDSPFPVFHVEKSIGSLVGRGGDDELSLALSRFEINCALAHEMGAEILVFHLWNGPESDKNIERNIVNIDFTARYAGGTLQTSEESTEVIWATPEKAMELITFPLTKKRLQNM